MSADFKENDTVSPKGRPAKVGVVSQVYPSGMVEVEFEGIEGPVLSHPSLIEHVAIE